MRISDWSSHVCSSDLSRRAAARRRRRGPVPRPGLDRDGQQAGGHGRQIADRGPVAGLRPRPGGHRHRRRPFPRPDHPDRPLKLFEAQGALTVAAAFEEASMSDKPRGRRRRILRSEEHTSELQSLMRISYAVFCLKKKKEKNTNTNDETKQQQKQA